MDKNDSGDASVMSSVVHPVLARLHHVDDFVFVLSAVYHWT